MLASTGSHCVCGMQTARNGAVIVHSQSGLYDWIWTIVGSRIHKYSNKVPELMSDKEPASFDIRLL